MQASVGDGYATDLAGRFYGYLASHDAPLVSSALAHARRDLEQTRPQRPWDERLPEYATPALFTAAREIALLDRSLPKASWKEPEQARDTGAVPMLSIGDLVGRRSELRRVYRILTDHPASVSAIGRLHGCQITGMGGVGKSTLAGRLMSRLSEEGWLAVSPPDAHWSLAGILEVLRATAPRVPNPELQRALAADVQDDHQRLSQLKALLSDHRILLVLDNFEDNLTPAGDAFRDPLTRRQVLQVIGAARRGRVLITSRYPVPEAGDWLAREELGALTDAQVRKLLWRHEKTLRQLSRDDFQLVLRSIGGHPRMIEYLHGLLNQGSARFPSVTALLRQHAKSAGVKLSGSRTWRWPSKTRAASALPTSCWINCWPPLIPTTVPCCGRWPFFPAPSPRRFWGAVSSTRIWMLLPDGWPTHPCSPALTASFGSTAGPPKPSPGATPPPTASAAPARDAHSSHQAPHRWKTMSMACACSSPQGSSMTRPA
jgi:hypothetical protein